MFRSITSSNGGGVQSQKKDLTPKQILHEINKYKYKNFSFELALSDRSVKKIVVSLAASLFQGHEQGKLTEEKFNEYIQNAVKEIVEKHHYMGALPPGKTEEQIATDVLPQGLRDVFGHILNSGRNDDLSRLIDNFSNWSGNANTPVDSSMSAAGMTRAALTAIRSKPMSRGRQLQNNQQYSTTQATLQLYQQQWLTYQGFSAPAPALAPVDVNSSSLSSPEVSSYETIQGKVKLALDSNPHGQILLSINNNQELKEFIELTCKTDLLTDKKIVVDLNLVLNDESERLLHNINVNTKDLIFRTDIKQAAKLTEILKKRREGTQALIETLRKANPHMAFTEAILIPNFSQPNLPLLDSEIPITKVEFRCKSFYDVQVSSLENDFADKSISEILLIKKNRNTNQFELLDKVLKEKHLEKADFITANYNELVESLSSCITTVNDEASRQKIAALFIKSNVLALSGIESHSFEKLSDDEFAAYVLNEHLLKSSFDEIIEKKSSSLSVSVDAYLPNANSSEQFSQALRERFTRVPKTDDATYLMLDFKLNNQNFILSIADKFNDYSEAKSFVNEYFEQRFQLFGINSEKPDSKVIFKEFLEKTQGNYGITEQNLLEVIRSCEKHFADKNFPAIPAAIQDYLTPKDMVIKQVLTKIFSYPFFTDYTDYSEEQKSLYIDLQQQSQKSSDSNYITMNLFKKYFENPVKVGYPLDFRGFAFESLMMIASIDSYLENVSVFKYEPDLTKISTDKSFQVGSEVLNSPETLLTNILPPLDKKFIHDLPGYNQITNQVKSAFIDTLLGNSSFEVACDTLAKLLQDSIPSKETLLTVPVDEAFDPSLYSRVISNNGTEAQVLAVPPRASNDELFKKILEQCEFHLGDFAFQANLSTDKLQAVFNNSSFGKILETFTGGDLDAQQTLRKQIISTDLERNFPDKLFSDLISPNSYEIFNERDIKQQFLFAQLEQSENSTEILARINQLYEFITKTDSQDSSYQCVNGLVLDVEYHANCYQRLKQITEPAAIKQALFDEINSESKNWIDPASANTNFNKLFQGMNSELKNLHEAAKLGINSNKYKEFRMDILLMQRKGASEEEIKEFVKLNLVSVFDNLPENNAENIKAIWQVVKNIDSKLTSDMRVFSLSSLNLEPSIQIALDTPPVNKNQMQAALETTFAQDMDAPEIQFYLDIQKLATEMRSADPSSTDQDINNAVFLKLATYINQAAKEANINDFNLLALRDSDVPFVHNLLRTLESSNKALDSYFTGHAGNIFGASLQDVFQPLNLAITEEMKLHKDNQSLVKAYVDLCSGFNTKAPSSPQLDRTVNLQNLQLIEEFKTKYYQQNPQDKYDAENPAYLKALQGLDERYSSIVKASGNVPTMENIISLVERSNLEFASIVQVVKEERLSSLLASSGEPSDPDSVKKKIKNTETAVDQYTTLQLLYRESPAFFENYINKMIDGALGGGSGKAQNILKVFDSIITSLDSDFARKFSANTLANFTPLLDTYQEIRQKQNSKLYS